VREFSEQWFNEFKVGWRKTYIKTVRGILDKYVIPTFGEQPIGTIRRAQVMDFRVGLSKLRGRGKGTSLSAARINTVMLIFRQIVQEAAGRYEFPMPLGTIKPLKLQKKDVKPFTLAEVRKLCETVRPDYCDYLKVRFFTGVRSGELHGLKWKYVDFNARKILIREALIEGEDEYTKNDTSQRDIDMSELVYEALRSQHARTGTGDYVFVNQVGEPLDTANFTKRVWYPLLDYLGLERRRPYQTRHTCASMWLAAGETPEWCARQLGHASTEMLFKVYSRFVPNLTRNDGSAANRLINQAFAASEPASLSTAAPARAKATKTNPPGQPPP
jgi:integrase